jgi:hypothetical protein
MGDASTALTTMSESSSRNQGADQILDRIGFPHGEDERPPGQFSRTRYIILREKFPVNDMGGKLNLPVIFASGRRQATGHLFLAPIQLFFQANKPYDGFHSSPPSAGVRRSGSS